MSMSPHSEICLDFFCSVLNVSSDFTLDVDILTLFSESLFCIQNCSQYFKGIFTTIYYMPSDILIYGLIVKR